MYAVWEYVGAILGEREGLQGMLATHDEDK